MMRKYVDEFKRQTLKKVFDGQAVSSVSREIGVNESLIHTAAGNVMRPITARAGWQERKSRKTP